MRPALRLLMATPATMGSKSSLSESLALLPPLQLYRRILRVHRKKLEPEMRLLGDGYVKSEFRAHKDVENPLHIVCFPPPSLLVSFYLLRNRKWDGVYGLVVLSYSWLR